MGASNLPEESYLIKRSSVDKKVHRKCKGCEDDEKSKTRFIRRKRKSSSFEISDIAVKDISQTFSHEGPPLETTIREFMESKFAYDFSGVRIHADEEAARSAELANALAYTVGNDIVFGKGQYQPSTFEGKRLLAHELAHVIQQETTFVQNNPPLVVPFDVNEHDSVSNFTEHYPGDYTRRTRIGRIMSFVNTSEELANGYDANFDDGFLYQANGTTTCTFPAGTATSTVTNPDPCTADCTSRHEGVHAADIGPCCAEAGKAYRAAPDPAAKSAVRTGFFTWMGSNRAYFECRGYAESVRCADAKKVSEGCPPNMGPPTLCCPPLAAYRTSMESSRASNCAASSPLSACPYP